MVDAWTTSGAVPTPTLGSGNGWPADTLAAPNNLRLLGLEALTVYRANLLGEAAKFFGPSDG